MTDTAVAGAEPADCAVIEDHGYLEASGPMQLAGAVAGVHSVLVIIGEIRRRK